MMPEPTRIAVAVLEHDGSVLIGQRPDGAPLAGLWEFPGGKIEPGESPRDAAARECLEETGLAARVGEPYCEVEHEYEHGCVRLVFFRCWPVDASTTPKSPFRWVAMSQLASFEFPSANAALIARLGESAPTGSQQ